MHELIATQVAAVLKWMYDQIWAVKDRSTAIDKEQLGRDIALLESVVLLVDQMIDRAEYLIGSPRGEKGAPLRTFREAGRELRTLLEMVKRDEPVIRVMTRVVISNVDAQQLEETTFLITSDDLAKRGAEDGRPPFAPSIVRSEALALSQKANELRRLSAELRALLTAVRSGHLDHTTFA